MPVMPASIQGSAKVSTADAALTTFPRLLLHHAAVRGGRPAMREKDLGIWQTYSWTQVLDQVRALAGGLAAMGFRRGDNLAIIGENRPRLYWALTAEQSLGANQTTLAIVPLGKLLRADGYLDRLRAKGYLIEAPQ